MISTPVQPIRRGLCTALFAAWLILAPRAQAQTDIPAGKKKFDGLCIQCHRTDARGVPGMGMDLTQAPLVKSGSLAAIARFIQSGHLPTKEFSLGMPPNGGESLSNADRENIAAYLKSLAR